MSFKSLEFLTPVLHNHLWKTQHTNQYHIHYKYAPYAHMDLYVYPNQTQFSYTSFCHLP